MRRVEGVNEVHDLHVWTVAPGYVALSAHVTISDCTLSQAAEVNEALKKVLIDGFGIAHTTIQMDFANCGQGQTFCAQT